ncbi:MAG: DNA repair protein RecO [Burkholderiales bacterium]|nr:DNA repair protein RecO [Burkholderiales bacterium]
MATARATPPLAAFVLHSYDWSESSLIVDLFTRSQGRVVVVAKGAKRPTSNFRPLLLPFHPLTVWLSRAATDEQGEVKSLRAVEWGGGAPLPAPALMSGFYLNELLLKGLARQDAHPALFDAYAETLAELTLPATAAGADAEAVALRAFELVLLRELGWLPELDVVTASAEPLAAERRYTLSPEAGIVADPGGAPGTTWVALQAALLHGSAAALRQACAADAAALRTPLRNLVHYHLGTAQLRTRRVGLQLQRLAALPPER